MPSKHPIHEPDTTPVNTAKPTVWALVTEEPYRLAFPLGLLSAIIGVLLWPAHYLGWLGNFYPGIAHARLLTAGFLGSFIFGFFGTAFPRLVGVKALNRREFMIATGLLVFAIGLYPANQILLADICLLTLWIFVISRFLIRFPKRQDIPPPGFILVAGGLLCLILGLSAEILSGLTGGSVLWLYPTVGREMIYTAFPVLIFLGVAPYFFPKIMDTPNRHEFEESRSVPSGWTPRAIGGGMAAAGVIAGIFLKPLEPETGRWIFAFSLFIYGWIEIPIFSPAVRKSSLARLLTIGMLMFYAGIAMHALFPYWRVAWYHQTMIAGILVCMSAVSIRVVFGHSGERELSTGKMTGAGLLGAMLILTALTRASADLFLSIRPSHLIYSALLLFTSCVIWVMLIRSRLLKTESESDEE